MMKIHFKPILVLGMILLINLAACTNPTVQPADHPIYPNRNSRTSNQPSCYTLFTATGSRDLRQL